MTTRVIVVVWTLALVCAAGATAVVITSDHAGNDKLGTLALAVPVGLAFVAAGLIARARRPRNRTGSLLVAVGFAWFLGALPTSNSPLLFTAGLLVGSIFVAVLVQLLLAFPTGRLERRIDRAIVVGVYALVLVTPVLIYGLGADTEATQGLCEGPCPDNLAEITHAPRLADGVEAAQILLAIAFSLAVIIRLVQRWRGASPALRRSFAPVLISGVFVIFMLIAVNATAAISSSIGANLNWLALVSVLSVPLAFLFGLLRPRFGAATRRLVMELSEQRRPEEVQEILRRALRDPSLELGYLTATEHGYVDVSGGTLRLPAPGSGRMMTNIGEAIIVHDSALADQPELDEVVGAAHIALERGLSLRLLEASERRAEALLVHAIPDNVYRLRADGTCIEAHVKGDFVVALIPKEQLVGATIHEALPAHLADQLMDGLRRVLATGEVETLEYHLELGGHSRDAEARIVRAADDEVLMIFRDVSERKRQELELQALAAEQAALSRVAVAVATEHRTDSLFNTVTEEVARLFGARWAATVRYEDTADVVVVGEWHAADDFELELGARFPLRGGAISQAKETCAPARIEYQLDPDGGRREMVAAPIIVSGRIWGATSISMSAPHSFPRDAEERLGKFTTLVAVALADTEAREQLRASRARIVRAGDEARWRMERNLHDGAQQRLVSLSLMLGLAQQRVEADPTTARDLLDAASDELAHALEELRELARGLHPAVLTDRGLPTALEALASRAPIIVELHDVSGDRFSPSVEAAAYYVVAESLTNVAKYAEATAAQVSVTRRNGVAVVVVTDDGVGGADASRGSGLRGLADRVEALEGRLEVESTRGRGTVVRAEIPIG